MSESNPTPLSDHRDQAVRLTAAARQALAHGERTTARRLAAQAAAMDAQLEDAWLVLAAVANPQASTAYLKRALEIHPGSRRAEEGLRWASARLEAESIAQQAAQTKPPADGPSSQTPAGAIPPAGVHPASHETWSGRRVSPLAAVLMLCALAAVAIWSRMPAGSLPWESLHRTVVGMIYTPTPSASPTLTLTATSTATATPSETPTATATFTATPTFTLTSTSTPTDTPIPTDTPTATPTASATATLIPTLPPTNTPIPPPPEPTRRPRPQKVSGPEARPQIVDTDENWIDVDLSSQTTYAMIGDQVVNSFVVSTGLWPNVTVTGVYRIYVKYRTADMYGEDYYLSGVPYVMYFHKGYGLHGTYWHNNFGTPMSHGCVNLRPAEAGWLFEFARVGTVVSVHP